MRFVLLFLLGTFSVGLAKKGRALGNFGCPEGTVLVIYDEELPYAVHMTCQVAQICDRQDLSCVTNKGPCSQDLSFLQKVTENKKFERIEEDCCLYGPEPQEYDSTVCFDITVTDKKHKKEAEDIEIDPELQAYLDSVSGQRRAKRASIRSGLAQVYRHHLKDEQPQILIVKSIDRIEKGYAINACYVLCKDTTTTSTRKPETDRPDYEDPTDPPDETPTEDPYETPPEDPPPEDPQDQAPRAKHIEVDVGAPGGAGGAGACFASDSLVQTPTGTKRMDELDTHEQVLVSSLDNGAPVFLPIQIWYHRLAERDAEFVRIETAGKKLLLSPFHLLPITRCDHVEIGPDLFDDYSVFAERASVGLCVVTTNDEGQAILEPITAVGRVSQKGIYSPITAHGSLVVNGVHVSCFSSFENHRAQHTMHSWLMKIYSLFHMTTEDATLGDIPAAIKLVMQLAQLIVPESFA